MGVSSLGTRSTSKPKNHRVKGLRIGQRLPNLCQPQRPNLRATVWTLTNYAETTNHPTQFQGQIHDESRIWQSTMVPIKVSEHHPHRVIQFGERVGTFHISYTQRTMKFHQRRMDCQKPKNRVTKPRIGRYQRAPLNITSNLSRPQR